MLSISTKQLDENTPADDTARQRVVLATVAFSVLTVVLVAGKTWSDGRTAIALSGVNLALLVLHVLRRRDRVLARLLLFGFVFGLVELVADALCVQFTGTLDYAPARSAMLWLSPWWMPVAWMIVATQIGYLGAVFIRRFGMVRGTLFTALLGALNIPFYEEMAYYAHWWQYRNCTMFGHTPLYIILAELLIGLALGPLTYWTLRETSWRRVALYGGLGGLSTIIGGLVGYGITERILPGVLALISH